MTKSMFIFYVETEMQVVLFFLVQLFLFLYCFEKFEMSHLYFGFSPHVQLKTCIDSDRSFESHNSQKILAINGIT